MNEPDVDYSYPVGTDSLQRRNMTLSPSADRDGLVARPPHSSPGWVPDRAHSGKRRKLVKSVQGEAKLASPSQSQSPFQGSNHPQMFARFEEIGRAHV